MTRRDALWFAAGFFTGFVVTFAGVWLIADFILRRELGA